jgi:hypothetical protein
MFHMGCSPKTCKFLKKTGFSLIFGQSRPACLEVPQRQGAAGFHFAQ